MNIIDAIKSGRPFRRKSLAGHGWRLPFGQHHMKDIGCNGYSDWTLDGILADDWEVQEPKVSITRTQFWEAAKAAIEEKMAEKSLRMFDALTLEDLSSLSLGILARKLGLEDGVKGEGK